MSIKQHFTSTMGSFSFVWCLLLVLLLSNAVLSVEKNSEPCEDLGFGYELVHQQLEQLKFSFMEVFVHIKELGELVVNNQRSIEQNQQQTNQLMQLLGNNVAANVSQMVNYSKQILNLQTICANHDSIRKELLTINPSLQNRSCHHAQKSTETTKKASTAVDSCDKINSTSSGLFEMSVPNFNRPLVVFCEVRISGGWLVFQHRFNGSVNFNRNWNDYRNGFGTVRGEFWLGLEAIHQITQSSPHQLMIELETYDGNYTYARYTEFVIGSEGEKYALAKISGYSGTAGDQLSQHIGMKFTTLDSDNDLYGENCAVSYKGAWWHNSCTYANLNGLYLNNNNYQSIHWKGITAGIKFTRMMISKK